MKISYQWLAEFVDISCGLEKLCEKLTMAGIEVEAIEESKRVPDGVVIADILERQPHPNAEKLSVCRVSIGRETLQIVCGAPNCDAGKRVPLATVGTVMVSPEGQFKIKKSKLRGVESCGMMCSGAELGLNDDDAGLLELSTDLPAGTPLGRLYPGDACIEVEVTPNRPDWLSHWGIARDVACLLNTTARLPEIAAPAAARPETIDNLVTVEAPDLCPLYTARVIRNVKIAESPDWLKERLQSIGLRPINNVVDVTNFVLMELGQPLHAFDRSKLSGGRVVARRARDGETITTLDGKTVKLAERHLVIADAGQPMALAGIMGGESSGVTESTTEILLESALFQPSNIRATSRELGISSDSSYRYERGVDFDMVKTASDRAVQLILATAGGELVTELAEVCERVPPEKEILCRFDRVRRLLGYEVDNEAMMDIFRKLRLTVFDVSAESCRVRVPRFRPDLEREADLAEEVARINGLDMVPLKPVAAKVVNTLAEDAHWASQQLREELIHFGLYECMHYSMVSEESALSDKRFRASDLIRIGNPLSLELAWLRPSLWGEMLQTVERNVSRRNLSFRLFEFGRVFCGNAALFPEERTECCIMISGRKTPERYSAELEARYDFYDLKGLLESLFEQRKLVDYGFEATEDARFAPHCCAAIKLDGRVIGHLGKLAPEYTKNWRTADPVFAAVFEVAAVLNGKIRSLYYQPLSQFPATTRDVAFIARENLTHAEILKFIRQSGLKNLEKIELFDIFEDEKILGPGRKSMAYKLTFRNAARTLTDEEVNAAFEKLRKRLAGDLGVELR